MSPSNATRSGPGRVVRPFPAVLRVAGWLVLLAVLFSFLAELAPTGAVGGVRVPWWVLAPVFAVAQACIVNVQVGREARSISLTELPFVVGLLHSSPAGFLLARITGGLAAQVFARRQYRQPVKLFFNTVLVTVEAIIGLAIYRLVAAGAPATSLRSWSGAVLAAAVTDAGGAVAVAVLIRLIEGGIADLTLPKVARAALGQAAGLSTIGVVISLAVGASAWAVVPLGVACAVVVVAYSAYATLAERHHSLERLYQFTQVVTSDPDTGRVLTNLLAQVCEMLHADSAVLTFFDPDGSPRDEASWRRGDELLRREATVLTSEFSWLVDAVRRDERSVLVQRSTRELAARHWLEHTGLREAIVVPLRGDDGVSAAVIVTDRLGEARGFDRADVRLLETVANHASVALRNGQLLDRLRHDSLHDALTGMPNRTHLHQEIDRLLADPARMTSGFALAMFDLDSFKDVNDTLGHHHGDALLCEVARRLTAAVGDRALVARFGGDEFAVLIPGRGDPESAAALCRELLGVVARPASLEGTVIDVSASVGIACAPSHATERAELVKRADLAMHAAKQSGREVTVFDAVYDTTSPARLALVAALRQAVTSGAIDVYVQPKISLTDGRVVSVEALARWTDAEHGVVPPVDFIPLAERTGLIGALTDVVLEKSVSACAAWQDLAPGVGVAVNLSARSLRTDAVDGDVERLLSRYELAPHLLTLELTEGSVMSDPASTLGLLHRLRDRGVRLSIDDFGTGYSSLSYLRRLPVQEVKIDRSFVHRMDEEAEDAAIVRSILQLARTLDLTVVAEGVEREAVRRLLATMGCDIAQGYLISRPMPVSEFAGWLRNRGALAHPGTTLQLVAES